MISYLNGLISKHFPKDVFVGCTTLELGVASAIISFNDGLGGAVKVFSELSISPGKYTDEHCLEKDNDRINLMERKSTDSIKQRCKFLEELNIFLTQIFRFLVPFHFIKLYGDTVIVFCLMACISESCLQDIYCQIEFH